VFLVDDLVLAPIHGLLWIFGKIRDAAEEEIAGEADRITAELSELYMRLETGRITEAEFEARERVLLDRLEAIQQRAGDPDENGPSEDSGGTRD
jgi:hypothetical protein